MPGLPKRLALVLGSAMLLVPRPGHADDVGAAKDLLRRGVELRRQHRNGEALALFQRALGLSPTPIARAQVALAEQALGCWLDAERDLDGALAGDGDPWIAKNRDALDAARQEVSRHLAWISVSVDVPSAEIRVDGRAILREVEEPVVAGAALLEVLAQGYAPDIRHVEVAAASHAHFSITLVPLVAPATASAPPPEPILKATAGPTTRATDARDLQARLATAANEPTPIQWVPAGPIALGIVGLAAIGLGSYFGLRAYDQKRLRDEECSAGGCAATAFTHDGNARSAGLLSTAAFGVTAVAWSAGTAWWVLDWHGSSHERGMKPSAWVFGAIAVAGAAAGATFGALAFHDKGQRDAQCRTGVCSPAALSYDSEARTAADLSTAAFVTSGVFVAGAATAWLLDHDGANDRGRAQPPGVTFAVGGLGVTAQGRFE